MKIPQTDVVAMAREATGAHISDFFNMSVPELESFAAKCAAYDNADLSARADKVMIANATGNPELFTDAVSELIRAIRARNTP